MRLKLVKGASYSYGGRTATNENPYIEVESESEASFLIGRGYFAPADAPQGAGDGGGSADGGAGQPADAQQGAGLRDLLGDLAGGEPAKAAPEGETAAAGAGAGKGHKKHAAA